MKIYTIAFTSQGAKLQETIKTGLRNRLEADVRIHLTPRIMEKTKAQKTKTRELNMTSQNKMAVEQAEDINIGYEAQAVSLREFTQQAFENADQIIYIGAAGIAVRAIAPFIVSKESDPGVMVIDELGQFVIPILSGHIGGSNAVAQMLAEMLGSTPVITTATDINNRFAVDTWAVNNNMTVGNIENIKHISAAVLENRSIGIYTDLESPLIKIQLEELQSLYGNFVRLDSINDYVYGYEALNLKDAPGTDMIRGKFQEEKLENIVLISNRLRAEFRDSSLTDYLPENKSGSNSADDYEGEFSANILHLIPKNIFAGIGCRKNKDPKDVESLFKDTLAEFKLDVRSVNSINTVDLKKDEEALLRLSDSYKLKLNIFTAEELSHAEAFTDYEFSESELVKKTTGVGNICERAAVVGAGNFINDLNKKKIRGKVSTAKTAEASNEALTEDSHNQRMTGIEKIAMLKIKTKRDGVTIAIVQI